MGSSPSVSTKHEKPLIKPIGGFSCVHAGFRVFLSRHPQRDFAIENAIFKPNLSRIRHAVIRKTEGLPSAFVIPYTHRSPAR